MASIKEQQDGLKEANNMDDVLLVLEDVTKIRDAFVALEDLGYTGRHFGIQVLFIAHKMSSIFRGVRTQTQQWVLFEPHEQSEWQWVLEMFSRKKTQHIWEVALRRARDKPWGFVYIDFERKEFHEIYRSTFNEPLFTPQEQSFILTGGDIYFHNPVDPPDQKQEEEHQQQQHGAEG